MNFNKSVTIFKEPFTHGVVENFLPEYEFILDAISQEEFIRKESDLFQFYQTNDFETSQNITIQDLRKFFMSPEFVNWMAEISCQNLKEYVVDLHSTIYTDTDYLLCHDDQLDSRRIAFLYYLTDLNEDEGGELVLWDSEFKEPVKITPKSNKLAFFVVSDKSFHEVAEVLKDTERIAIGGWLHDK